MYWPALQALHTVAPSEDVAPEPQLSHTVDLPTIKLLVSAAHGTHFNWSSLLFVCMEYLPAAHKLHPSLVPLLLDTPVAEENLPAGHTLQDTMDVWKAWSPY